MTFLNKGLTPSPGDPRDFLLSNSPAMLEIKRIPKELPVPFDLPVTNQGKSPSCVGHAGGLVKQYMELKEKAFIMPDREWLYKECVVGETEIPLLNGEKRTIESLYDEKKENFWVYSFDIKKEKIVPGLANKVIYLGEREVYEITLDNGKKITTTPDSEILKRDNKYSQVKDLSVGDSLEPLYRKTINKGKDKWPSPYEFILDVREKKWKTTHSIVVEKDVDSDSVIHHKDFNSLNNSPENLQVLSRDEHIDAHRVNITPDKRKEINESIKGFYKRHPEVAKERGKRVSESWAKLTIEERAERLKTANKNSISPEANKKRSKSLKRFYQNNVSFHKGRKRTEEEIKKCSEAKKVWWSDIPSERRQEITKKIRAGQTPESFKKGWKTRKMAMANNHKIIAIKKIGLRKVYDIQEVKDYHNFGLRSGIFIHNCKKIDGIPNFSGTYFRAVLRVLRETGCKLEGEDNDPSIYRIAEYRKIDDMSFEGIKKALALYGHALVGYRGSNIGWANEEVRPPRAGEKLWSHAVTLFGYDDNYIYGQNSWGQYKHKNGIFKAPSNYLPFEGWTVTVDRVNEERDAVNYGWIAVTKWTQPTAVYVKDDITTVNLRIREKPGLSHKIIGRLSLGAKVNSALGKDADVLDNFMSDKIVDGYSWRCIILA